jgi:hypothetical protein
LKDSNRPAALSAALRFVIASETLSEHRAILIEVLTQAMRDESAAEIRRQNVAVAQAQGEWRDHEIAQLKSFLQGRTASSWQHADEGVMHLAAQLHRAPQSVRTKATELGLGSAVDYRLAKELRQRAATD